MLRSVELKDYMISNPVTVSPEANLFDAIHQIIVNKVSGVCVVDDDGCLVGMLSELDCLDGILSVIYNESGVGTVADVMTTDIVVAHADEDIVDLAADMLKNKHRRRPVVADGKLVGQITCRQLLRAVKEFAAPTDPTEYLGAENS